MRTLYLQRHSAFKPIARARGFTLVELMIGLVIGLIVLGIVGSIYMSVLDGSGYALRSARLNQEVRVAMNFMTDDIRRAGFWSEAQAGTPENQLPVNPFTRRDGAVRDVHILNSGNCILFAYDADFAGAGGQEVFGYRLNGNTVEMLMGNANPPTNNCAPQNAIWTPLTDKTAVVVTALSFDTVGSRCFNTTQNVGWTVTAEITEPACLADEADVIVDDLDGDGTPDDYVEPDSGDLMVESRLINITLAGNHANDANLRVNLQETVKIRNNRIFLVP
ncbi:PilW family protein [Thiorhodospira sibirica]|uniref:PilW family protein n=1 Tax=Thiorhodospira sibirica TaxID=154347 RepID=UPI00022C5DD6|nr:prepilin-type N-terminal cleavage/methylation domain-containing protein [Thiorhodospira sibirica]